MHIQGNSNDRIENRFLPRFHLVPQGLAPEGAAFSGLSIHHECVGIDSKDKGDELCDSLSHPSQSPRNHHCRPSRQMPGRKTHPLSTSVHHAKGRYAHELQSTRRILSSHRTYIPIRLLRDHLYHLGQLHDRMLRISVADAVDILCSGLLCIGGNRARYKTYTFLLASP